MESFPAHTCFSRRLTLGPQSLGVGLLVPLAPAAAEHHESHYGQNDNYENRPQGYGGGRGQIDRQGDHASQSSRASSSTNKGDGSLGGAVFSFDLGAKSDLENE